MSNFSSDESDRFPPRGTAVLGGCMGMAAALLLGWSGRRRMRAARAAAQMLALHEDRLADWAQRARHLEHDLRSPLGAMAVALELLRSCDDPAMQAEAMAVMERQIARMTSLTEQLREFSQGLD